jgi:manganese oxidase
MAPAIFQLSEYESRRFYERITEILLPQRDGSRCRPDELGGIPAGTLNGHESIAQQNCTQEVSRTTVANAVAGHPRPALRAGWRDQGFQAGGRAGQTPDRSLENAGCVGLQKPIAPGETFTYEFTVHQEGTFFYHAHSAMQEMIGLIGMFIAHPREERAPRVDHDYGIVLQEWAVLPNNSVPNTANMEFNWLTFNGVAAPLTTPLLARLGSRVRLRFVNLGMDHHPIHLHGNQFVITGTEGGRAPESTWFPSNTTLVGVAQARVVEFDAKYPGAWMIHCHLPHHMMNSMMDLLQDRQIMTSDQTEPTAMQQMQALAARAKFQHQHPSPVAPGAEKIPGFPQDAFMEMGMDELVQKPETHGLPKNWSAGMMGMMTMVRVLPDKEFDEIAEMQKSAAPTAKEAGHALHS